MIRYELEYDGRKFEGALPELKQLSNNLTREWAIYKYISSSMDEIKVSEYRKFTIQECRQIAKEIKAGVSLWIIGDTWGISPKTAMKIFNDDFKVLKRKYDYPEAV